MEAAPPESLAGLLPDGLISGRQTPNHQAARPVNGSGDSPRLLSLPNSRSIPARHHAAFAAELRRSACQRRSCSAARVHGIR